MTDLVTVTDRSIDHALLMIGLLLEAVGKPVPRCITSTRATVSAKANRRFFIALLGRRSRSAPPEPRGGPVSPLRSSSTLVTALAGRGVFASLHCGPAAGQRADDRFRRPAAIMRLSVALDHGERSDIGVGSGQPAGAGGGGPFRASTAGVTGPR